MYDSSPTITLFFPCEPQVIILETRPKCGSCIVAFSHSSLHHLFRPHRRHSWLQILGCTYPTFLVYQSKHHQQCIRYFAHPLIRRPHHNVCYYQEPVGAPDVDHLRRVLDVVRSGGRFVSGIGGKNKQLFSQSCIDLVPQPQSLSLFHTRWAHTHTPKCHCNHNWV